MGAIKATRTEQFDGPMAAQLLRVQKGQQDATAAAQKFPDTASHVLQVTFTAGQIVDVPHRLGRAFQGYYVLRAIGAAPALYEPVASPIPSTFARLKSDTAGTFIVRFF